MKLVSEIMEMEPVVVGLDASIEKTIGIMNDKGVSAVIVSGGDKPAGIFSEKDLLGKVFKSGGAVDLGQLKVRDYMTTDIISISSEKTMTEVALTMKAKRIRHMPVVDDGVLTGMLSQRKVLEHYQDALEKEMVEKENAIKQLQELQIQASHSAKLATMGEMSAEVAHEMNQPLMGISTHLELLLMNEIIARDEKVTGKVQDVKNHFRRLISIVKRLNSYAKVRSQEMKWADINSVIEESLNLFRQQMKDHNIEVCVDKRESLPDIFIDIFQMQDVTNNFIVNSTHAIDDIYKQEVGGKIRIFSKLLLDGDVVVVGVNDNGRQISSEAGKNLFKPFFTTKGPEKGTGLGLSVSTNVVKTHGGIIDFVECEDGTKTFYFILPVDKNIELSGDENIKKDVGEELKKMYGKKGA